MKRICFFSGDITRSGGTERVCVEVAKGLAQRGHTVCVASLMESANTPFYGGLEGIGRYVILKKPVSPISRAVKFYFAIVYRLVRFVKREKIDVLVSVDGILDVFSLSVKLFSDVKVVTWEHFNYFTDLGNRFRFHLKKISARFSDYIVVLTEEDMGYYRHNLKLKAPIEFIYNPVDICGGAVYNAGSKQILSAGRFVLQKGFDLLADVAKIVFERHPDWTWTIAGDGEGRADLEKKIHELKLSAHINLPGNVKNIEDFYAASAIFVLTSRFEGFGMVIAEARRHRLPVVSFACPAGPRELILDGHNGFLVECFDIEEMARKIIALIDDENLRLQFSQNAHDDAEKLAPSSVIDKWEELIKKC